MAINVGHCSRMGGIKKSGPTFKPPLEISFNGESVDPVGVAYNSNIPRLGNGG